MKCGKLYNNSHPLMSGLMHFLNQKQILSTVHPVWIVVIYVLSFQMTTSDTERILFLLISLYSVLFEMLNSALELTHDRFGCEFNSNTKQSKEIAGAVTALSRIPLLVLIGTIAYRTY